MKPRNFFIIMCGLMAGLLMAQPSPAATNAVIISLSGEVRINGKPADLDQVLKTGDRIQTGSNGVCEVTIGSDAVLRCYVNTDLTLMLDQPVKRLALTSGSIGQFVKKSSLFKRMMRFLSSRRRFEIDTPTSVIGVRGTTFYVRVEDPNNSYICCCNGEITTMDSEEQNRRKIRTAHHKAIRITKGADGFIVADAAMLYHQDPEMEALAAAINGTIDWSKPDR